MGQFKLEMAGTVLKAKQLTCGSSQPIHTLSGMKLRMGKSFWVGRMMERKPLGTESFGDVYSTPIIQSPALL